MKAEKIALENTIKKLDEQTTKEIQLYKNIISRHEEAKKIEDNVLAETRQKIAEYDNVVNSMINENKMLYDAYEELNHSIEVEKEEAVTATLEQSIISEYINYDSLQSISNGNIGINIDNIIAAFRLINRFDVVSKNINNMNVYAEVVTSDNVIADSLISYTLKHITINPNIVINLSAYAVGLNLGNYYSLDPISKFNINITSRGKPRIGDAITNLLYKMKYDDSETVLDIDRQVMLSNIQNNLLFIDGKIRDIKITTPNNIVVLVNVIGELNIQCDYPIYMLLTNSTVNINFEFTSNILTCPTIPPPIQNDIIKPKKCKKKKRELKKNNKKWYEDNYDYDYGVFDLLDHSYIIDDDDNIDINNMNREEFNNIDLSCDLLEYMLLYSLGIFLFYIIIKKKKYIIINNDRHSA